jgi:hypothetical protein
MADALLADNSTKILPTYSDIPVRTDESMKRSPRNLQTANGKKKYTR